MKELDHLQVELSGRNLIEASAGTGKTYAIACLYLRLLIEKDLTPEQILVVTYTEAATEELRGRIRKRIRQALEAFAGVATDDTFLIGLCANSNGKGQDRAKSIDNLDRALKTFDTASIFTIHGFCLRALQDNAFESGSLYDTELITDQSGLLQEIVDDFWRIRFFTDPAPLLGYALQNGYSPDYFLRFLKKIMGNLKQEVIPQFSTNEISVIEENCISTFASLQVLWMQSRVEIEDIIKNDKGLSRSADKYHMDLLPDLFSAMSAYLAGDNPFDFFKGFEKFCAEEIYAQQLKKNPPPQHRFFNLCEELRTQVNERFLALRWELVEYSRERLPAGKQELNIRFFDDLLNDLYIALCGPNGTDLAENLRRKYKAALIDEFQDTDPVQYDIFRKIYASIDYPLFLIGDPKQAIYSFRGADIFAYLEAASDVQENCRYTLTNNWRSTPQLLAAFNAVFNNESRPFVFDSIIYHPIKPGRKEGTQQLVITSANTAPLQLWVILPDKQGEPLTVGRANIEISSAVAAEIARLLQLGEEGMACIDGRPVIPDDIAVIVRSHRQAGYIQEALKTLGIPSIMRSDKSIFTTDDAKEVRTLLNALADPGNETKVRAALVSDILGRSGNDIIDLLENEQAWEELLGKFRAYHQTWLDCGFMVMARTFLDREGVRGRLLRRTDGERRLTNLLHCFEVIHKAAHEKSLGIEGVLTWFGERISAEEASEEYQIRLESDERAVKIVTIHVSKGLEYPIVFCPFMWGGISSNDETVSFHDGFTMMKDFGSSNYRQNRVLAQNEALAESLRLLYVALTRAKFRCYLFAGKIVDKTRKNRPETSPLAYLFHSSLETKTAVDLVARLADEVMDLSVQKMDEQLRSLTAKNDGNISVAPLPNAVDAISYVPHKDSGDVLTCRKHAGVIDNSWRVASFTSFAAHEITAAELPDRDQERITENLAAPEEMPRGASIFTFPKGAQAGIFFHEIFEKLDFACCTDIDIRTLADKGLSKHGYDKEWLPHVCSMVKNITMAKFQAQDGVFSLAELKKGSWITELEFFFPLRFVTSTILRDCFRNWSENDAVVDLLGMCRNLSFRPVQGMVRGFMDMVFEHNGRYYLVDWKSNHLGYRIEDYGREILKCEMERNLYPLQYLLYTVALNRYLSLRVRNYEYAKHFGGVLYIFLRGVNPEHGEKYGIFRDTPPEGLVCELTKYLIQAGG